MLEKYSALLIHCISDFKNRMPRISVLSSFLKWLKQLMHLFLMKKWRYFLRTGKTFGTAPLFVERDHNFFLILHWCALFATQVLDKEFLPSSCLSTSVKQGRWSFLDVSEWIKGQLIYSRLPSKGRTLGASKWVLILGWCWNSAQSEMEWASQQWFTWPTCLL